MSGTAPIIAAFAYCMITLCRFLCLSCRWDNPLPEQDGLGQAILWPLFAAKYVSVAIIRASKELRA